MTNENVDFKPMCFRDIDRDCDPNCPLYEQGVKAVLNLAQRYNLTPKQVVENTRNMSKTQKDLLRIVVEGELESTNNIELCEKHEELDRVWYPVSDGK